MNVDNVKTLQSITKQLAGLNKRVSKLQKQKREYEDLIIEDMTTEGTSLSRNKFGTVSLSKANVASVKDWNEFEKYIYENKALYLLQRRPANIAYREELKTKGEIPGVETFEVISLNLSNKAK